MSRQILYAGRIYQVLVFDDRRPPNWRGRGHVTHFKLCFNHMFGIGKARHFKFRVLFEAQEY